MTGGTVERIDTLVIGGGQAGLAMSYWLTGAGVEHLVLDRRDRLGGSWHDRWDEFHLVLPNFTIQLPGMPYDGDDPDGYMARDEVVAHLARYAAGFDPPARLGTEVTRLTAADGDLVANAGGTTFRARDVVLATGPYPRAKIPAASDHVSAHVQQLHSGDYRRPGQLADGGVLVVGAGQSGAQIAEELHRAGREVHLAVSTFATAPRRYRGRDIGWWLLQVHLHGAEVGVVLKPPPPAARFDRNPLLSGQGGGHSIDLRQLARDGVALHGRLESADGTKVRFHDDLAERLAFGEAQFDKTQRRLFDAYAAAAGLDVPPDDRRPTDDSPVRDAGTELDLADAGIGSVVWATGYRLDFGWVDLPVFDEYGFPRHTRGVTTHPGLYAVGLPWLHSMASSVVVGAGADAAHIVEHIVDRREA
ncbi:NAD(P)/FAD-dependent oxidoreductase [Actinosynnema sp. NPDC047251]|uniref:Putative FAD dependent oxidoreductase n=1 Tax=Saccharothrix espanaensis (strain ATCC 51144 / DSM 44229 / JCM 9112 / NBRC 15066 / NRRL 15764) TaxID=1179773 RepID=K0JXW1_SACES|nr:NAD(P)/FAD-dependent oxidoreductase [Saccharothrix espanaensis]CCH32775.1 putative FAD dependent oxidoreductase [Saccharothrix espanaensis DSM 44229]